MLPLLPGMWSISMAQHLDSERKDQYKLKCTYFYTLFEVTGPRYSVSLDGLARWSYLHGGLCVCLPGCLLAPFARLASLLDFSRHSWPEKVLEDFVLGRFAIQMSGHVGQVGHSARRSVGNLRIRSAILVRSLAMEYFVESVVEVSGSGTDKFVCTKS